MEKKVLVVNRASCGVSYEVPELMVSRTFRPFGVTGDRMLVSPNELQLLAYTAGGKRLLDSYLMIDDNDDLCTQLGVIVEPEYHYGLEEIRTLLKTGTEDELLDCLDFAPQGVLDLLKKEAVEMRLDSMTKRKIISEKLKINLDAMIKNDMIIKQAEATETVQNTGARRVETNSKAVTKVASAQEEKPAPTRRSTPVEKA